MAPPDGHIDTPAGRALDVGRLQLGLLDEAVM
jgi:hypothetical protein